MDADAAPRRPPLLVDSAILIVARVVFFALARRFLQTLSPTLRELQKPDVSLPVAQQRTSSHPHAPTGGTRPRSASALSGASIRTGPRTPADQPSALPDIPDTEDEDTSPPSSYPGSPASARSFLPRSGNASPGPSSRGGPTTVEMQLLGAKLQPQPRVIELAHSAPLPSAVGTKRVKRAARGLSRVARTLFAVCFAESMTLIAIVVAHAIGILHAHALRVNFSVSLHILLALILLVVPLVQCLLCTYRSRRDSVTTKPSTSSLSLTSRILISLLPFAIYMFLFTRIPPYITAVKPANDDWTEGWEGGGWLESSLGRVVVLGVVVIAGLSGIGAVVTAWDYLEQAAGTKRVVTDADVLQAERSLYRVRADAQGKRDEMERLARAAPDPGGSGWMTRVFGSKAQQEASALAAELATLEVMEADISRSVVALRARHKAQGFRATLKGTVYNVLGYVFAIYCVARLLLCAASLLSPFATSAASENSSGNSNGDWISFVLALALSGLDSGATESDIARWSRTISLLFTGALVVSSLAMVMRWLARVLRLTSRTVGAGFLLLTLGQLFATYTIALLVQLRSALPPSSLPAGPAGGDGGALNGTIGANATATANYTLPDGTGEAAAVVAQAVAAVAAAAASADDSLLRSLPTFRVFGALWDGIFLVCALSTFVYRWVAAKVSDDGDLYEALGR